jgi:hypothetical protein
MNKEKLVEEQKALKEKLVELIEFINSEEFFKLSEKEKSLINSQRVGMEMYINALTIRVYGEAEKENIAGSSNLFPLLLLSMFTGFSSPCPTSGSTEELKKVLESDENKEEVNE